MRGKVAVIIPRLGSIPFPPFCIPVFKQNAQRRSVPHRGSGSGSKLREMKGLFLLPQGEPPEALGVH